MANVAKFLKKMKIDFSKYPATNNNFLVLFGPLVTSFQEVSGLEKEVEVEYYKEGGNNGAPLVFPVPKSNPHILTFKKGVGLTNPLTLASGVNFGIAFQTPVPGTIIVLDNASNIKKIWAFNHAIPIHYNYTDLSADGKTVMIETIQMAHNGLISIPIVGGILDSIFG